MKIRVLSDLHLEFEHWDAPQVDADVVVLAGDIYAGSQGISWARRQFKGKPVLYVPGNHEYWGEDMARHLQALRVLGKKQGVHVLDRDSITLDGVRFLGATAWTDYQLYGDGPAFVRAQFAAERGMDDFRTILMNERALRANDLYEEHAAFTRWLATQLDQAFSGPTVLITHHAPCELSLFEDSQGNALNPSFASNLTRFMSPKVPLWIHGHVHASRDYEVKGTRVVCNPRGYAPHMLNYTFNSALVVSV